MSLLKKQDQNINRDDHFYDGFYHMKNNSFTLRNLNRFDKLAVGWLLLSAIFSAVFIQKEITYFYISIGHLLFIATIVFLSNHHHRYGISGLFRFAYPVILIAVVHWEIEPFLHQVYGEGVNYDAVVKDWDQIVFGNPHISWHKSMPSLFWVELFHFFYMTYYPLLIGSILWIWRRRFYDIERFAFVYLAIFLSYVSFYLLFPVFGPLEYRSTLFQNEGILPGFVDFLFTVGAPDGAAFPSSHVGQSVGVFLLLQPLKRKMNILILTCIFGIGLSMVYISIHYATDALAGLISGTLLYYLWNRIYRSMPVKVKTRLKA